MDNCFSSMRRLAVFNPPVDHGLHVAMSESGDLTISWVAESGSTYQLQERANLLEGVWQDIGDPGWGSNDWMSVSMTPVEAAGFYRTVRG